ncbi:MAG TPA: alpha-amylase family glycosyl hydrolase, partial [Verrucomicrobiae bacterium]|nr:alpha-amylase family glycosyl hydrolase [Verrucomicrobiae bacterium]
MDKAATARKFPVGAEVLPGGVHFRVWAPKRKRVEVVLEDSPGPVTTGELLAVEMEAEADGFFSALVPEASAGSLYRYRLDGGNRFPDPASRFQPAGPHGCSEVIDAAPFEWHDADWRGVTRTGQVLYEMHVGTFTPEGTWEAACRELPELAALGVTVLEVMPVAEFPGRFGWGYDGVDLFAPTRLYGRPDDFRAFVDTAHRNGLGVILDVVYNHLGPEGNYLKQYSEDYFTNRYLNEWGEALNFDGPNAARVREFFCTNAEYWIREFHLDGLRLDATQQMFDFSPDHILAEIARRVRGAAGKRSVYVIGENEPQNARNILPPELGGHGLDAQWNDDFH